MNKHLIISLLIYLVPIVSLAQQENDTQYICAGEEKNYHLETVTEDAVYQWEISPADAGIIEEISSDNSKITVKWTDNVSAENYLSVKEVNSYGCESNPYIIKVVIGKKPSANFNNENVICFEDNDQLIINLEGNSPYTIQYTFDDQEIKVDNIASSKYLLEKKTGKYKLLKISNSYCEVDLSNSSNEAEIAQKLNNLNISVE